MMATMSTAVLGVVKLIPAEVSDDVVKKVGSVYAIGPDNKVKNAKKIPLPLGDGGARSAPGESLSCGKY
jgi:hypothetical protein